MTLASSDNGDGEDIPRHFVLLSAKLRKVERNNTNSLLLGCSV